MKKNRILHPFLFAAYPVLSLLAFNINQAAPAQALRSFVITLLVSALLLIVYKRLLRDWGRAGLLVSAYLILFFSYGHIIRLLERTFLPDPNLNVMDLHRYLTSAWAVILILGSWWTWRIWKWNTEAITQFLNVVAAAALIVPLYTVVFSIGRNIAVAADNRTEITSVQGLSQDQLPDIYYIILDAYARADVLEEVFEYDNSEFLDFLRDRGFFVASGSQSNYAQTSFSLSSSLNFEYIDYMTERVGRDSQDRKPLTELIKNSKVRAFLEEHGYQTVAISSGWAQSEWKTADVYLSSNATMINEFEGNLLRNTLPGALFALNLEYEMKRQRILYIFDSLKTVPTLAGPKFVFVHVYSPHGPTVFGANGEKVNPQEYDLEEVLEAGLNRGTYTSGYRGELTYLNKLLIEAIDSILSTSERPPIIVLQGDHGPRAHLDWGSVENTCLKERMSVFNAYYLPNENGKATLYDTITPVNSFRIIFNAYFGTDLDLLEDRSYFSLWHHPYDFIDVTDQIEASCLSPESSE